MDAYEDFFKYLLGSELLSNSITFALVVGLLIGVFGTLFFIKANKVMNIILSKKESE